jgi:aminoglycoside 6-adenylyltransferase
VEETKSFHEQRNWIDRFGERLYMQYPDDNSYYKKDVDNCLPNMPEEQMKIIG